MTAANMLNQYAAVTADGADMPVTYDRWVAMTRFGAYSIVYSGWNPVVERVQSSGGTTATVRYVWGKDLSGTLQGAGGVGGAWYFPAYDANGNITQYVDADGHVVASYAYDAFGNTVTESGAMAGTFPFRFSTKYYDSESGLYYYGYRFYSPKLGRWMNRDPIEEDGGVNLYGFCGNRTLDYADRLGQFTIHLHLDKAGYVGLTTEEGVIYVTSFRVPRCGLRSH